MKESISILKVKTTRKDAIKKIEETDADYIHVDLIDGVFVSDMNMTIMEAKELLDGAKKPLDIHLMVASPKDYIDSLQELNPAYITIQSEIDNVSEYINLIHSYNIKAGLALKPETNIEVIKDYLDIIDYVLVLGVHPGKGGQELIPEMITKGEELIKLKEMNNYSYIVTLDGGVNLKTRPYLDHFDMLISGSYVCMSDNFQEKIDSLR